MTPLSLSHGLGLTDLYDREGLVRLDAAFVDWLKEGHVDLHARLLAARTAPDALADKDESNLLIEIARPLEDFVGVLFGVAGEASALRARHNRLSPLYDCKRLFVQRYVTRAIKAEAAMALDGAAVTAALGRRSTRRRTSRNGSSPSRWRCAIWWAPSSRSRRRRREVEALDPLRRLGAARARGQAAASRRCRCSRRRTSSIPSTWCRSRPRWSTA